MEIVVSHSKRKERVLNGAQSIEGEPRVEIHDRATCPKVCMVMRLAKDIAMRVRQQMGYYD